MAEDKTIHVVGAGPAGLVAAINLQRSGYNVIVHEKEAEIGGPPSWHPSVHVTPMDFDLVEEFTGIDMRPAFDDVSDYEFFYDHGVSKPFSEFIGDIDHMNICIRGPHEKSLDNYLYQIAKAEGVDVRFNDEWKREDFDNAPDKTIVATGFGQGAYEDLDYRFTPFYGFWTRQECDPEEKHISIYTDDYTNEYGYSASKDGMWYALIFCRGDVDEAGLQAFSDRMKEMEGREATFWGRFTGATTRYARLFDRNMIFAGTASGFMGPAQGYGILSALLGGKIAAMAVEDPEGAAAIHDPYIEKITKHISMKLRMMKEGTYKPEIFFRRGELWFDIPTIRPDMRDSDAIAAAEAEQ